jgi:hypothetical protein
LTLPTHIRLTTTRDYRSIGIAPAGTVMEVYGEYGPRSECWKAHWHSLGHLRSVIVSKAHAEPTEPPQAAIQP